MPPLLPSLYRALWLALLLASPFASAQPGALRAFVEAAGRRGVRVWAVVGDPAAVIESQRAAFERFPRAYSRYNAAVPAEAYLACKTSATESLGSAADALVQVNGGALTKTRGDKPKARLVSLA